MKVAPRFVRVAAERAVEERGGVAHDGVAQEGDASASQTASSLARREPTCARTTSGGGKKLFSRRHALPKSSQQHRFCEKPPGLCSRGDASRAALVERARRRLRDERRPVLVPLLAKGAADTTLGESVYSHTWGGCHAQGSSQKAPRVCGGGRRSVATRIALLRARRSQARARTRRAAAPRPPQKRTCKRVGVWRERERERERNTHCL